MNINFAKQIVNELENKIIERDFWICKYEGGRAVDVKADDIINSTKKLIEKEYSSISSGNYKIMYSEGTEYDEGDKIYIFKDYLELTIPRRENLNEQSIN